MDYTPEAIAEAIESISNSLGVGPSRNLQQEYNAGLHPTLCAYDKIEPSEIDVPVITRYLVSATSSLTGPNNYYNIYAAARGVNMLLFLDAALKKLGKCCVTGLDVRLDRLKVEKRRDAFDAIAFEVITGAAYAAHPEVTRIEFKEETRSAKTPDFLAWLGSDYSIAVECKKVDRTKEFSMEHRNNAAKAISPVLHSFRQRNTSVLLDITFHVAPGEIHAATLLEATEASLSGGCAIVESGFTVAARVLPTYKSDDYILFPAPKFLWERYGYKIRSEWIGIVPFMECSKLNLKQQSGKLQGGESTWIDDIRWDGAAKWKISSDEVMSHYRRFNYSAVFEAFKQVDGAGDNSAVHVWLETDYFTGPREEALRGIFIKMERAAKDYFGWLVFNEMLIDVSPGGRFDVIENSHVINGPLSGDIPAPVTTVFVPKDAIEGSGEFGRGIELPEIDDVA